MTICGNILINWIVKKLELSKVKAMLVKQALLRTSVSKKNSHKMKRTSKIKMSLNCVKVGRSTGKWRAIFNISKSF